MDVRIMVPEDYEAVIALLSQTARSGLRSQEDSPEGFTRFLNRNPDTCFIAEEKDLVGVLVAGHDGRRGHVYHVAVKDPSRAKAITRAMLEKLYAIMKRKGIQKVGLLVDSENDLGAAFWTSNGWTKREDLMYFNRVVFPES